MKLQATLLAAFAFLFAAVSAARYNAVLKFQPAPRIFPQPYFTMIELPTIGKTIRVNFWQSENSQYLTEAYPGRISRGYVDVDDLSAFNGRYKGLINDDTEALHIRIQGNGQILTFIGQSATEEAATNMKVRADVQPVDDDDYQFGVQTKASDRFSYHRSHVHRLNDYYEHGFY